MVEITSTTKKFGQPHGFRELSREVIRIDTDFGVYVYLIQGQTGALLIDTGYGIGNLRDYVAVLTSLPYQVVCTHGHVDHAGGNGEFEKVYLHPADAELVMEHTEKNKRIQFAEALSGRIPEEKDMVPQYTIAYAELYDGQIFDLGGLTAEVIACPGHTQGTVCLLLREKHLLLLGDACNSNTFLFFPEACGVEDYLKSLERLNTFSDQFDEVLFFHPDNIGGREVIRDNIALCREILSGNDDAIEMEVLGYKAKLAKKRNADGRRLDHRTGNILYK